MLPLATFTLAAMTAFVPVARHSSFEPTAITESRYADIAADIAAAAEESPAPGLSSPETAVLLASVASYESEFSARVDSCRQRGGTKTEPAFTIFQIAGRRDLCSSRLNAARTAAAILGESLARCRGRAVDALSFFTRGKCGQDEKARWRYLRARAWSSAHQFDPTKDEHDYHPAARTKKDPPR